MSFLYPESSAEEWMLQDNIINVIHTRNTQLIMTFRFALLIFTGGLRATSSMGSFLSVEEQAGYENTLKFQLTLTQYR